MSKKNKVSKFEAVIMFLLVGIIPFIVQGVTFNMPVGESTEVLFDYFNYCKVFLIKSIALVIFINFIAEILIGQKKLEKFDFRNIDKKYLFLGIIALSVIIAYIFSDFKEIARIGANERFEGIGTHFSYIIIFIFSLKFFKKDGAFNIFSYAILVSSFVVGGIGTLQFFNVDLFSSSFMKVLTYRDFDINIVSDGSFTTMYNLNTSASYSLLVIFILVIILLLSNKNMQKIVAVLDLVFVSITFYNSRSATSFIALVVGVVLAAVLYSLSLFINSDRRKLITVAATCTALLIGFSVYAMSSNLTTTILEKTSEHVQFVKWEQDNYQIYFYNKFDDYLKTIITDEGFELYENEVLLTSVSKDDVGTQEIATRSLRPVNIEYGMLTDGYYFIDYTLGFNIIYNNDEIFFINESTGEIAEQAEFIGFENYPDAITNRGYIWSRTLPLILDNPIVGYGADVYSQIFPNNDFVAKSFVGFENTFVDKPHSIYLNMWVNNGILYLIGFIAIVGLVLLDKFKLLYSLQGNKLKRVSISVYIAGVFAYLINGIATDNLVIIVVTFWIYLAISNEVFEIENFSDEEKNKDDNNKKIEKNNDTKETEKSLNTEVVKDEEVTAIDEIEKNHVPKVETINYDEIGISYKDLMQNDEHNE